MPVKKKAATKKKAAPRKTPRGKKVSAKKTTPRKAAVKYPKYYDDVVGVCTNCDKVKGTRQEGECLCGRPSVFSKATLSKLEEGAMLDLNNRELSIYAEVNYNTLNWFLQRNEAFWQRLKTLKSTPGLKAKKNIISALDEWGLWVSTRLLERKQKAEYSLRQENFNTHSLDIEGVELHIVNSADEIKDETDSSIWEDSSSSK